MSLYLELFIRFLKIGAFSFGGGYVSLSLLQSEVVEGAGWLTASDFVGLCAIAEMTPGPIALNAASFTGWQTAGILGAFFATLGYVLPSVCLVTLLSLCIRRFGNTPLLQAVLRSLRPVICAMVTYAALSMFL